MKSRWLSAAFLAVALAVSACGGTEETGELGQVSDPALRGSPAGDVTQMLLDCDEEGQCPEGYYCDGAWVCRRSRGFAASETVGAAASIDPQSDRGAPASSLSDGTCHEECRWGCNDSYPDNPGMANHRGARETPAKFSAAWKSPVLVPPSPM